MFSTFQQAALIPANKKTARTKPKWPCKRWNQETYGGGVPKTCDSIV
jgi:hypothetical protein